MSSTSDRWTILTSHPPPQPLTAPPKRRRVEYVTSEEPAFIKRFKQNAGMKPSDTVADKRAPLARDADDLRDRDDEQPQIVIEYGSGVSEKEAADFVQRTLVRPRETDGKEEEATTVEKKEKKEKDHGVKERVGDGRKSASPSKDAKPIFRMPARRTDEKTERNRRPEPPKSSSAIRPPSSGLLSFAGEEEEEDSDDDTK
ncbi:hypothetical protein SprV_0602140100 [Sparganum proliferum]